MPFITAKVAMGIALISAAGAGITHLPINGGIKSTQPGSTSLLNGFAQEPSGAIVPELFPSGVSGILLRKIPVSTESAETVDPVN